MNSDQDKLITICITAYRRPSLILQALLSCLAQEYRPLEIDVSDDSPNADVEQAIRLLRIPEGISLRYRRNSPSLGEPANVNSLFANARGSRLLLLHDDDQLAEGAVAALAQAFAVDERVIATFGFQDVISHEGEAQPEDSHALNEFFYRTPSSVGVIADPLLSALRRQFPNNSYLIQSDVARSTQYRSHGEIGRAGDTDFGIRLGQKFSDSLFVLLPRVTSRYRITRNSSGTQSGVAAKLYASLNALESLTPEQAQARDELMRHIQSQALLDYAAYGERRKALQIYRSRAYRRGSSVVQRSYHLALILAPRMRMWGKAVKTLGLHKTV